VIGRLLCFFGFHWIEWKSHLNFHSFHAVQTGACTRCLKVKARVVRRTRIPRGGANTNCGADRP